jgi:hypothetical protein
MTSAPREVKGTLRLDVGIVLLYTDGGQVLPTTESAGTLWDWANGQAVTATVRSQGGRLLLESLRVDGDAAYGAVSAIEPMQGKLVVEVGAPGTKLAGDVRTFFDASTGERFGVLGGEPPPPNQLVTVRVRRLVARMSYAARETGIDVYFVP